MSIIQALNRYRKARKQQKYEKNKLKKINLYSERHGIEPHED